MGLLPFSAIPGPRGLPFIGSLLDYSRFGRFSFERMHLAKQENYQKYGKIYREKIGRYVVQLFDPVDIETVYRAEGKYPLRPPFPLLLVAEKRDREPLGFGSLNGQSWWRIRKAVHATMMPPGSALAFLPVQNRVADDLVRLIDRRLAEGQGQGHEGRLSEDITEFLTKYTMEAFGAVCFDVRIGCLQTSIAPDSEAFQVIQSTGDMFQALQKTTFAFPSYAIYRTKLYRQFLNAARTCHRIANVYVEEALRPSASSSSENSQKRNFLRILLENNNDELTREEIVRLTIDLFTAGIDSTAFALSFCLYNLAANGDKQDLLVSELDSILGSESDEKTSLPVTSEALNRMRYLKACVIESFRLNFPVEGGPVRELSSDLVLSNYHVPKGTLVALNYQTMCLQDRFFDRPLEFLPERWLRGDGGGGGGGARPVHNFVMLPFGYGSRTCIGRRFAEQEIYLALIKILRRFRLRLDSKSDDRLRVGMINRVFTMPDVSIPLLFSPRYCHS